MPRPAHPWYRSSRSMWYATVDGKKASLGISDPLDEAAAWEAFKRLLQAGQVKAGPPRTVAELVSAFLEDAASRVKPRTLKGYAWYAGLFTARFGAKAVTDLTPEALEADSRRAGWSSSTRNNYLSTIATVLGWGGVKLSRPLKKPPKESAGAASVIAPETYQRILSITRGDWRAVIEFLWETGARPSEASAVTLEVVDWAAGVVRLRDHKTRQTSKTDRLIYCNDAALDVLRTQQAKYPAGGHLFRGLYRQPFSPQAFVMKFQRLSVKLGVRVCSYFFRHSLATRALASGESDAIVAALLGHSGTNMIWRNYGHVSAMGRQLRDAAGRVGRAG
jgi:integrase